MDIEYLLWILRSILNEQVNEVTRILNLIGDPLIAKAPKGPQPFVARTLMSRFFPTTPLF